MENDKTKITYALIIIAIISIIIIFVNISPNIINAIKFIGIIGIIITAYSIYMNIDNQIITNINSGINYFNTIFNTIDNTTLNFFDSHHNMKYYYNNLYFNIDDYKESDRNIYLERLYTSKILANIDYLINYIDSYKIIDQYNFQVKVTEEKLVILIKQLFKSKIFTEHWNEYKDKFALNWTKRYIEYSIK